MELKVVLAAAVCLASVGVARGEHAGPEHKFSCLHYCQTQNYGQPVKYCCRAARVLLATVHFTGTTHTATTCSHFGTTTLTTTATPTTKTLTTVVSVVATPVLANLLTLSLGPAAKGDVPATLYTTTTTTPHLHPDPPIHRGKCPPPRDYCPRVNPEEPSLTICHTDDDCFLYDKCCYDSCLYSNVCKTADPEERHRRSSELPYGGRDVGAAAATRVVVREDGEPLHVLLDQDDEAVAAVEGDVLTIIPGFSPGSASSRVPTPPATVPLTGNNLVYIVEDENGEVVVDASGNTLTLVSFGEGPTVMIHDAGMRVVRGRHPLADDAVTGTVRSTLVPDLTVHTERRYSRETSRHQNYHHSRSFNGPVLTGRGRDVTLRGEEPLRVVNSDGVTFVIDISTTAEVIQQGGHSSIAVIDTEKLNTDVMVDGEGNLIVDANGRLTTVQDIVGTMTDETDFENRLQVIVDGRGNTVTLLDANNNVATLLDQLGKEVSVAPGDYHLTLSHYSYEATVHVTEDGFSVITDGSGIVEDKYGYPLLLVPYQEHQEQSILDYYSDYGQEYEGSGSGEPSMEDLEDMGSAAGEDMEMEDSGMYGSGEEDMESSGDADMTQDGAQWWRRRHAHHPPGRSRRQSPDGCGSPGQEEDTEMMMQGNYCKTDMEEDEEEMDESEVIHVQRRHLLTITPLKKVRRSTLEEEEEEDGETTEEPATMAAPEEGSGQPQRHRRHDIHSEHERKWKHSVDDPDLSDDHTEAPDEGVVDASGWGEEDDASGMEETTYAPEYRRRRHVPPMMPIPMMKRSVPAEPPVPTEPAEGEGTVEGSGSGDCQEGTLCGDVETTDDPMYRRRRYAPPGASRLARDVNDDGSDDEDPEAEEEVPMTEGGAMDHTEGYMEEVTIAEGDARGRRSVQQQRQHTATNDTGRFPRQVSHLPKTMRNFGVQALNMADNISNMNELLRESPSTIVREMTGNLDMKVKDPSNFIFILAYSVERIINTVIEVLQKTDIPFQGDPDGRVLDVVLSSVMQVVLSLLEEALDIASQLRRLTTGSGRRNFV